jgi:hypothetical protein
VSARRAGRHKRNTASARVHAPPSSVAFLELLPPMWLNVGGGLLSMLLFMVRIFSLWMSSSRACI